VAHLHYVLFMSSIFGVFGAIYFWFPKMFGRMLSERWGKVHFALTFLFANCTFFPMHIIGIAGHPRRYYDVTPYNTWEHLQPLNQFMTISAICLGLTQLIFVTNFAVSLFRGKAAGRNPWHSNSLEWTAPSPAPHGNFEQTPTVRRGPYEYSLPGAEADYLPQTEAAPAGVPEPAATH
jgi:cytochrome c oxidase subunit 1